MHKVSTFHVLLAALLGAGALLLTGASTSSSAPPFSRSQWLEEHEVLRNARGTTEEPPAARPKRQAQVPAISVPGLPAAPPSFRVSSDVLSADRSAAQPETQAEPFLALNPEREGHLVATYQEGRFSEGGARALTWPFRSTADGPGKPRACCLTCRWTAAAPSSASPIRGRPSVSTTGSTTSRWASTKPTRTTASSSPPPATAA